jgi:hypothetical protein
MQHDQPHLNSKHLLVGVALKQCPLAGLALQQVGGQRHLTTRHLAPAAAAAAAAVHEARNQQPLLISHIHEQSLFYYLYASECGSHS